MPARRRHREAAERRHRVDARKAPARSAPGSRSRSSGTTARGWNSAAPSRSTTNICSPSSDEVANKGAAPVTLFPYALISRHGTPQTVGYYILHEGLIGVLGDQGLQEDHLQEHRRRRRTITFKVDQWLARHHRQILGGGAVARHRRQACAARFLRRAAAAAEDLPDRLPARRADASRPARPARPTARLFAGAKEVATVDGYDKALELNRFELLIDWGWFYFITKPMFKAIDCLFQLVRQFRHRHPDRHRARQVAVLPARQQILRLDGEDEGGAAGDDGDPRALRRRQDEAAAGDDGAVQEGEDQSARRLPADRDPDPGVLRALQGAVRHHRDAPRAVLRLDQGPFGARPDQPLHPVRADPVRPDRAAGASARSCISASGRSSWASRCGCR